ncbi:LysE family translocator [Acidovorax sp. Be4]|uniref:LysE family translocator n=1 Tax=Acidovorax bellezanensis TaxID=2976702 RepID=A0ABT2PRA6_9BURK|nr:LysE family translocator [Acidovorax sp. Be4]MCT9813013.1 LysE family translocator [Acidovorax sp. Be4]
MNASAFYPLLMFTLAYAITPGPNNVMLAASGATFGYRRSLPHMLGVCLGAALMLILVGCGLLTAFERLPYFHTALKYLGAGYLVWLAWRIAGSQTVGSTGTPLQPLGFGQAMAFQWVNPKSWIMAVGIVATYTPHEGFYTHLWLTAVLLIVVSFPSISLWTLLGRMVARALPSVTAVQRFNRSMAGLLLLSLYPLAAELWEYVGPWTHRVASV